MVDPLTVQLIRKLHYQGKVTDARLQKILDRFRAAEAESLIQYLIGEDIVDEEWVAETQRALRIRARRQRDSEESFRIDRSFGGVALRKQLITVAQLEEAILEQQRLHRLKLFFRIGEILLNLNHVTSEEAREILMEQGNAVGGCEGCSSIVRLVAGVRTETATCPFCNGTVTPAVFLDLVHSDG